MYENGCYRMNYLNYSIRIYSHIVDFHSCDICGDCTYNYFVFNGCNYFKIGKEKVFYNVILEHCSNKYPYIINPILIFSKKGVIL